MRTRWAKSVLLVVVVVGLPLSAAAPVSAVRGGQSCSKLGQVTGTLAKQFVCTKVGTKKKWRLVATTVQTAVLPSLTEPIQNLQRFIDTYAQPVVTVSCDTVQGSAVATPIANWTPFEESIGAKTRLFTNHHVVYDCIKSFDDLTQNKMTILFKGVEYVGYVSFAPSWNDVNVDGKPDLASISTTALIPVIPNLRTVPAPALGDVVVAVGSAGGYPNVTTRGEVAGINAKDLVVTAQAGHGSSGGAVFNTRGQLLGIIYSVNGNLTQVVPISRICEVFGCATPIVYIGR